MQGDQYNAQGNQYIGSTFYTAEQMYDVHGLPNPYLGLRSFTYDDGAIYAGRDAYVAATVARLTDPAAPLNLLFVTGASGSGKSSFVQAGLLPALEAYYSKRNLRARHVVFRPGSAPLANFADALAQLGLNSPPADAGVASLGNLLKQTPAAQVNIIVIDQFEEVLTLAPQGQRDAFFDLLEGLTPFRDSHTQIICTLRVDYLPNLFSREGLYGLIRDGVELRTMSKAELKLAIEKPLQMTSPDKRFESALVERLASDTAADSTYLPLLQVTLEQLWNGGWLKLSEYRDLAAALRSRAEDVYTYVDYDGLKQHERSEADRYALMSILTDLVQVADEPQHDVRIQRERSELVKGSSERERLISDLAAARLLSISPGSGAKSVEVDIIHESLIRNWDRLQEGIKSQRQELEQRESFERVLREWRDNGRRPEYLLSGIRLAEAKELESRGDVALQDADAKELLRRSIATQEAEQQRQLKLAQDAAVAAQREAAATRSRATILRRAIGGISVLLIAAIIASLFAFFNATEATRQKDLAQAAQGTAVAQSTRADAEKQSAQAQATIATSNANRSESERLAATTRDALNTNPMLAVLLGYEAVARDSNVLSYSSLSQVVAQTANPIASFSVNTNTVTSAVYSPDGSRILTASSDNTARLWDKDGKPLATLSGHSDKVSSAIFSPDGSSILTASSDGTARLWDKDGKPLVTFSGHSDKVSSAIFSPDGSSILTASADGTARLWDKDGKSLATLSVDTYTVNSAVFSPDGSRILTASDDGTAQVWAKDGKPIATLSGHSGKVSKALYSPDGNYILTAAGGSLQAGATPDDTARLWSKDGKPLATLYGHIAPLTSAVYSPDGNYILTAAGGSVPVGEATDNVARLWDKDGKQIAHLTGHSGEVSSAVFSPDGNNLLTASADGTARLWDINGKPIVTLIGHNAPLTSAVFSPDGQRILTASSDGTIHLWDTHSKPLATLSGDNEGIASAAFSPDQQRILTASYNGTARLWDKDGKPTALLSGHSKALFSAVYSPDGSRILTASADNTARLWDKDGKSLATLSGHSDAVTNAIFSPDSSSILTASDDGTARLWDKDGKPLATLSGHSDALSSAVYSPDGSRILTASSDKTARLWDKDGKPIATISGHSAPLYSAVFSPDGNYILTAAGDNAPAGESADNTARLWDKDGKPIAVLTGHSSVVFSAVFSPDGQRVLTASYDGTARLWGMDGKPIATLSGHTTRLDMAVYSPDGSHILTSSEDKTTRLWDKDGSLLAIIGGSGLGFSPDSKRLLVSDANDIVRTYPVYTDDLLAISACRVDRGLTAQELQQFQINKAQFDISKRVCPAPVSWDR